MAVIDMAKGRLNQQLDLIAELAGKPAPSEKTKTFYGSRLKFCDPQELERAFGVFGDRGVWPTVEQLLRECGQRPVESREEQEASLERDRSLPKADPAAPPEPPTYETQYGEWSFRATGPVATRQLLESLSKHGWEIIDRREHHIVTEEKAGRIIKRNQEIVTEVLAVRWKTPPTKKEIPAYMRSMDARAVVQRLIERTKPK